uniref:Polynucleotide adenylyltransferase n=1 Tax=Strongyloides venezuelensis TaxID=75913 RepID=A0A0K0F7Y4_STRVS
MPNIFQLTTPDLISLLRVLKPDVFIGRKLSESGINDGDPFDALVANNFSTYEDCKKLRSKITEWLLLNGFSTMHQFNKDPVTNTWIIPNKNSRSVECGKYRVAQKVPIIIPDPLFDETPYLFNPTDDSNDSGFNSSRTFKSSTNDGNNNSLIRTKSATDKVLMKSFLPLSGHHSKDFCNQTFSPIEYQIDFNKSSSINLTNSKISPTFTTSCTNNNTEKYTHLPKENSLSTSVQNDVLPYCKNNTASFCSGIFQIFMCQQRI